MYADEEAGGREWVRVRKTMTPRRLRVAAHWQISRHSRGEAVPRVVVVEKVRDCTIDVERARFRRREGPRGDSLAEENNGGHPKGAHEDRRCLSMFIGRPAGRG